MSVLLTVSVTMIAAYLIGAIPFSLVISTIFYHVDLREHGSGNLGATNVVRVLGWRAGVIVAVLDAAKGAVAVYLAALLMPDAISADAADWVLIGAACCAMAGHSYSPYIRFRGGKGVATAAGSLLLITPIGILTALTVFFVIGASTRIVSLASIVAAALYPVLCVVMYGDRIAIVIMSFVASAIVLWRHRSNMSRIIAGTESRIGRGGSALTDITKSENAEDVSSKES